MRKAALMLILTGLALCLSARTQEIRAIWVLPWSMNTPEKVEAFVSSAAASQQTDIYVEVRYRSDALYQTNRRPDDYPNPEYRSHVLDGVDFDPLELILREAHKRNLRVHAWIVVLNATPSDPELIQRNYIYRNHRDWITFDRNLLRPSAAENAGHYIDPGIPEAREHIFNVVGDLLSGYPELDGLHLDYIRYPNSSLGYHPISMSRYNDVKAQQNLDWNEWRILQVTSLVETIRQLVDKISPGLILSAAVMPDPDSAARYYAQDWKDWLERGLVDYVCPMNYSTDIAKFRESLDAADRTGFSEKIVMGIRAWNNNGDSLVPNGLARNYNIMDVVERIGEIRKHNFAGIALFSYDGLLKDSALQHLSRLAYSDEIIANLSALDPLGESTARTRFAADVKVSTEGRLYSLELLVPLEGRWTLELRDPFNRMHYRRVRYYLKGLNRDHWNGVLANGERIVPGTYLVSLFRDMDLFEYVIPVTFPGLTR